MKIKILNISKCPKRLKLEIKLETPQYPLQTFYFDNSHYVTGSLELVFIKFKFEKNGELFALKMS